MESILLVESYLQKVYFLSITYSHVFYALLLITNKTKRVIYRYLMIFKKEAFYDFKRTFLTKKN
jgi:hypothetical protein